MRNVMESSDDPSPEEQATEAAARGHDGGRQGPPLLTG